MQCKLHLLTDNVCGCRHFDYDYGGKYSDAYFTLLARFEYDNKCYLSNPYAHFKDIIKRRGFIDTDVYRKSNKGSLLVAAIRGAYLPHAHIPEARMSVVLVLNRHELRSALDDGRRGVRKFGAEDARLRTNHVTHLVVRLVILAVVHLGLADQHRLGWVVHVPHLHPEAADVAVAVDVDQQGVGAFPAPARSAPVMFDEIE